MTDQKRTQPRTSKPRDEGRRERPDDQEPNRFEDKRTNRDRSVVEQENQGHGPLNVGDQSRARN